LRRPKIIDEMNEYYRENVPYHDDLMGYTDNEAMERLLGPIIKRIEADVIGKDVLEVACGTGNWTQVLSKRASSVVATDVNEECLLAARKKEFVKGNVEFKVADAYSLEGLDRKFDVGFTADFFSHIPRAMVKVFFKALHSRLLPGSKMIIIEMKRSEELDKMLSHVDDEGNEVHERELPDGKIYHVVRNYPKKEEFEAWLGDVRDLEYIEDDELLRWVLMYSLH
jgi:demethylmenaquinone methyltransferase/2-methoxy-6-polyprenyl-1,4-benzoquinol methylase